MRLKSGSKRFLSVSIMRDPSTFSARSVEGRCARTALGQERRGATSALVDLDPAAEAREEDEEGSEQERDEQRPAFALLPAGAG
jgi:hypothetical protein